MATKRKRAAKSNPIAEFLAEVDRRWNALQLALLSDPEPPQDELLRWHDFEARQQRAREMAVGKLGDILDASTLDPFTARARAVAGKNGEILSAIKAVRQSLGRCVRVAFDAPPTTNQFWRDAWGELNESIHDLRPWCQAIAIRGGRPANSPSKGKFAFEKRVTGMTWPDIAAAYNRTRKTGKRATAGEMRKASERYDKAQAKVLSA